MRDKTACLGSSTPASRIMLPFFAIDELVHLPESSSSENALVPGSPLLPLRDIVAVNRFLTNELYSHDLEAIAPRLWIMTTPSSANVNPLHRQLVKGREIIVTEDPRLHLVWNHNRIFIKPLPSCLLSHKFWELFLNQDSSQTSVDQTRLRKSALGFLRTYLYLVQHESDLRIAQQERLCLVPPHVDWPSFCRFTSGLKQIQDSQVSGRYQYGELRLTRLNFYAPFLLRKFHFENIHGQYSDFFNRLFGPIVFIFAVISVMLNSMQVELAVEQMATVKWEYFWIISRRLSILSLAGATVVAIWLASLWLWIFLDEWVYTARRKLEARRRPENNSDC